MKIFDCWTINQSMLDKTGQSGPYHLMWLLLIWVFFTSSLSESQNASVGKMHFLKFETFTWWKVHVILLPQLSLLCCIKYLMWKLTLQQIQELNITVWMSSARNSLCAGSQDATKVKNLLNFTDPLLLCSNHLVSLIFVVLTCLTVS